MPIYAYQCTACGHDMEALQKISEAPLRDCPECGKPALTKKVTAAAFRLKGSGWYETDFKHKDKKPPAKKGEADAKTGDAGKGESKSADKGSGGDAPGTSGGAGKASGSGGD